MTEQTKPQLTDEQMNELVIADVNDPSAWGEPVVVGPSKGPRRNLTTGILPPASSLASWKPA